MKARTKKRKKSKKEKKKPLLEKMRLLVDGGSPIAEAARKVEEESGWKAESLRRAFYRTLVPHEKRHKNMVLTKREESWLLGAVLALSTTSKPLSKIQARAWVKAWKGLKGERAGLSSVNNFLEHFQDRLHVTKAGTICRRRVKKPTLSLSEDFVEVYEELLESGVYGEANIINVDEKLAQFPYPVSGTQKIVHRGVNTGKLALHKSRAPVSVIPFAAANGELVMQAFIFPYVELMSGNFARDFYVYKPKYPKRGDTHNVYLFSKKGRNNKECWDAIVFCFCEWWKHLHPGLHALLIFDGGAGHGSTAAIEYMVQSDMQGLFLPKRSTHFDQPLDDAPFGLFEKNLRKVVSDFFVVDTTAQREVRNIISQHVQEISRQSLTSEAIKRGFKATGLWPLNKELILRRARENVGVVEEDIRPEDSDFREGYLAFGGTVVSKPAEDMEYIGEAEVREHQVYLAEDLLENALRRGTKRKAGGSHGRPGRYLPLEAQLPKYEERKAQGERKLKENQEHEDENVAKKWSDEEWLRANTCCVCRAVYSGGQRWEAPNCEAFWCCVHCKGCARHLLDRHANECLDCKNPNFSRENAIAEADFEVVDL